jgi:GH25 family lysozyme M1 (1,4-beta-N-acetylmuramidase)
MINNFLKILLFTVFLLILTVFSLSCEEECTHQNFTQKVLEPTCDAEGKTIHSCTDCDFEFITDHVAPTGHTMSHSSFAPTCEYPGYTYYSCECGYSYKSDYISPLGHKGEETFVPATCSMEGYTLVACEACQKNYKKDIIPPISHNLESKTVEPTCDECGYTQYSCLECDFSYQGNLVAPKGHVFTQKKIGASLTHEGYTLNTCECEYSYKSDIYYYNEIFDTSYLESSVPISKGLDVSKWNHKAGATLNDYLPLDWSALRAQGFDFVILKIGSTSGGLEPTFEADYKAAKEAGFSVGVYFYTYATTVEQAIADADTVMKWLDGKQLEFPVFYDMEDPSLNGLDKDLLTDMCIAFIERLQENFYYSALYCNNNWLNTMLDSSRLINKVDIWYARWLYLTDPVSVDQTFEWNKEKYGKQLSMWQYAQTGVIDGFTDEEGENMTFDFNYCYKDFTSIIKQWHLNGY